MILCISTFSFHHAAFVFSQDTIIFTKKRWWRSCLSLLSLFSKAFPWKLKFWSLSWNSGYILNIEEFMEIWLQQFCSFDFHKKTNCFFLPPNIQEEAMHKKLIGQFRWSQRNDYCKKGISKSCSTAIWLGKALKYLFLTLTDCRVNIQLNKISSPKYINILKYICTYI